MGMVHDWLWGRQQQEPDLGGGRDLKENRYQPQKGLGQWTGEQQALHPKVWQGCVNGLPESDGGELLPSEEDGEMIQFQNNSTGVIDVHLGSKKLLLYHYAIKINSYSIWIVGREEKDLCRSGPKTLDSEESLVPAEEKWCYLTNVI